MRQAVRNLTHQCSQLQSLESRMEICNFVDPTETLDSPFELNPTTSGPELNKSLDDPCQ